MHRLSRARPARLPCGVRRWRFGNVSARPCSPIVSPGAFIAKVRDQGGANKSAW